MKLTTLACVLGTFLATHPVYAQLVTDALLPCSINPHQLTISDQGWRPFVPAYCVPKLSYTQL